MFVWVTALFRTCSLFERGKGVMVKVTTQPQWWVLNLTPLGHWSDSIPNELWKVSCYKFWDNSTKELFYKGIIKKWSSCKIAWLKHFRSHTWAFFIQIHVKMKYVIKGLHCIQLFYSVCNLDDKIDFWRVFEKSKYIMCKIHIFCVNALWAQALQILAK